METIVKRCGCGQSYTADSYRRLPWAYAHYMPADDTGPEEAAEFRHCTCRSTIAVKVDPTPLRSDKFSIIRNLDPRVKLSIIA